jgi:hypothetical protein
MTVEPIGEEGGGHSLASEETVAWDRGERNRSLEGPQRD